MFREDVKYLQPREFDRRDYIANKVLKDMDKIKAPKAFKRDIKETYDQGHLGSCTAMATTHGMKSQNEFEYKGKTIYMDWKDLWVRLGHSATKYDGGEYLENTIREGHKGIKGELDGSPCTYKSDAYVYGTRENRKKALTIAPLLCITYGTNKVWNEMVAGEVKTMFAKKDANSSHALMIAGYDEDYVYFYNSRYDKSSKNGVSGFKMKIDLFEEYLATGLITWRFFMLVDKKDLVDYAKEIELSKQIIDGVKSLKESQLYNLEIYLTKKYGFEYQESSLQEQQLSKGIIRDAKILYGIGDGETKKYFEEIQLTKFLEEKFKFKYYDSNSVDTCKAIIEAAKKLYEIGDKELKDLFEQLKITQFLEKKYDFKY